MNRNFKLEKLQNGENVISHEKGNSMTPLINSNQKHELNPVTWEDINIDDIVYCKVKGHLYTHIVKSKCDLKGCLIGNNKGHLNGWTKLIYGKVIKIF